MNSTLRWPPLRHSAIMQNFACNFSRLPNSHPSLRGIYSSCLRRSEFRVSISPPQNFVRFIRISGWNPPGSRFSFFPFDQPSRLESTVSLWRSRESLKADRHWPARTTGSNRARGLSRCVRIDPESIPMVTPFRNRLRPSGPTDPTRTEISYRGGGHSEPAPDTRSIERIALR